MLELGGFSMKSRLNLKPGRKGTKKLVEQYGTSLFYVRYQYDEVRGVRLKSLSRKSRSSRPHASGPGLSFR
jgi:hypothetical protein